MSGYCASGDHANCPDNGAEDSYACSCPCHLVADAANAIVDNGVKNTSSAMSNIERVTIDLDPEWTVARRWECGHVQHACCVEHLDVDCEFCYPEGEPNDVTAQRLLRTIFGRPDGGRVRFEVTLTIPPQDEDLVDTDLLTQALQERLGDLMGHYCPEVERID